MTTKSIKALAMKNTLYLIICLIVSYAASSMTMGVVAHYFLEDVATDSFSMFIVYSGTFVLTIVAMSIFGRIMKWSIPSARPRFEKLNLPLIVLALLMIIALDILLTPLFAILPESDLSSLYDMMSGGLWAVITGIIAAPICEEFLFRGILQGNLTRFTNPYIAIILASVIFGVAHTIPQQMIAACFSAIVIGTIFYLTGSLMTAVVIHILNNGIAYTQLMYFGEKTDMVEILFQSEEQFWTTYTICAIFIAAMLTLGIIRIGKRIKTQAADKGIAQSGE